MIARLVPASVFKTVVPPQAEAGFDSQAFPQTLR